MIGRSPARSGGGPVRAGNRLRHGTLRVLDGQQRRRRIHSIHRLPSVGRWQVVDVLRQRDVRVFVSELEGHIGDRHCNMCRVCVTEILSSRPGKKMRLDHSSTERICYLCRRRLPVAEFTSRRNGTYFSACKACKDCNRHVFGQRRRARLAGAGGSYTVAEWDALVKLFNRCPRCQRLWSDIEPRVGGDVITADHIAPHAPAFTRLVGRAGWFSERLERPVRR